MSKYRKRGINPSIPVSNTPLYPQIKEHLDRFRADLLTPATNEQIVSQYIVSGESKILDSTKYYALRQSIAQNFGVNSNEVVIVGSAKLGFSIAPDKRYRFFGDHSDIDVAVISPQIFDGFWERIYRYFVQNGRWEQHSSFTKYLFKGWIRPDMMPQTNFEDFKRWSEFFNELTRSREFGPYPIGGGLYKSWAFFEMYHVSAINNCKLDARLTRDSEI